MDMADPASPDYLATWAALGRRVGVHDVSRGDRFPWPTCFPRPCCRSAWPRRPARPTRRLPSAPSKPPRATTSDVHFVADPRERFASEEHPREIVERYYATSDDALDALRRGDIDAIDFLFPDDAVRLAGDPTSALPLRAADHPPARAEPQELFTANQTFRRAWPMASVVRRFLDAELLGNRRIPGCQLISGPFPIGTTRQRSPGICL